MKKITTLLICLLFCFFIGNNVLAKTETNDEYFKCEMFDNKNYKEMSVKEIDDVFYKNEAKDIGEFLSNLSDEDYKYILDKSIYLNEPNVEYQFDENGNVIDETSMPYYKYAEKEYDKPVMFGNFAYSSGYYTIKMQSNISSQVKVSIKTSSLSYDTSQMITLSLSGTNNHGIALSKNQVVTKTSTADNYTWTTMDFTYKKPNEDNNWNNWNEVGEFEVKADASFAYNSDVGEPTTMGVADGHFLIRINLFYNAHLGNSDTCVNGIAKITLQTKNIINAQYENTDGTFGTATAKYNAYSNHGTSYSWSQPDTIQWNSNSYSGTSNTLEPKTTTLKITRKKYDTTLNLGSNATMNIDSITYKNNDVIEGQRWGSTIQLNTPVRKGYIFKGWFVSGTGSSIQDNVLTLGTANTTVTANWEEVKAEGITLDTDNVTLYTKESYKLIPTITPEDTFNKDVIWKSTDENIATVDKNGTVTGIKSGECDITATTNDGTNLTSKAHITVKQHPEAIEMEKELTMYTDDLPHQLIYKVIPEDTTNKNVSFISNDITVATVLSNGTVIPNKAGECTITAITEDNNITAECHVVIKQYAKSIKLDRNNLIIEKDKTEKLNATVLPEDTSNKTVFWESSNPDVVSVDENGNIVAKENGKATITVKTTDGTNLSDTCDIEVIRLANDIKLDTDNIELYVDETYQLQATVLPEDTVNKSVIWKSTDESIATVDENGTVTGKKAGKCQIIVKTADGTDISAICDVTVKQYAKSIDVEDEKTVYTNNSPFSLEYEVLPEDTTNKTVKWTSSNSEVATIDENTGIITPVKAGECDIVVATTDGTNLSDSCHLTVNQYVTDIKINMANLLISINGNDDINYDTENNILLMKKGTSIVLPLDILPKDATNKTLIFDNNNNKIATINSSGEIKAKEIGVSNISITAEDDMKVSKNLTVKVYGDVKSPITSDNNTFNTLFDVILTIAVLGLVLCLFTLGLIHDKK
ncbi:Ig-like domain-containing protein [Anaerofustis sp. HA2171]|uniref:Ig-like domain-containing protein n=1 Tax=Anaerofustis butyriciformans TaxID=3108533 RepID=UPI002E33405F|nr:Ig-like domain-containing protein [Anaerofustis sp. HA2171]